MALKWAVEPVLEPRYAGHQEQLRKDFNSSRFHDARSMEDKHIDLPGGHALHVLGEKSELKIWVGGLYPGEDFAAVVLRNQPAGLLCTAHSGTIIGKQVQQAARTVIQGAISIPNSLRWAIATKGRWAPPLKGSFGHISSSLCRIQIFGADASGRDIGGAQFYSAEDVALNWADFVVRMREAKFFS